ncbi:hypothetical protein [Pseudonocardia alni]|uniref:hypothetical protein n=1 Tax=Pseudonocardia alni TaxID=33907 RepID=UPI0027A53BDC|nr:hypothetical protein PaSha_14030 [Pseudonocardia alni]WFG47493.1 hypothetical protein PaSha_28845 [Pseudonocardia alni]
MAGPWLINAVPLETVARQVSTSEGLQRSPQKRDVDQDVPGMHGVLDQGSDPVAPRRSYGPGQITFTGWVQGVDHLTGAFLPGTTEDVYYERVRELQRMFHARSLTIQSPSGRTAVGWLSSEIEPVYEASDSWFGRWSATVKIPGAFWSGPADVVLAGRVATGGAVQLGQVADGEAPIQDAVVTFGPGNNPTLIQGGAYLGYDGVIGSGRELAVDTNPAGPSVGPGNGALWTPLDSSIRYGPNATWFEIDPTAGPLTLNHTGGGLMDVRVEARPRYFTS